MKHFFPLIMATLFVFASCEGPRGMDGEDGEDGYNFVGTTFEFTGNFTETNDYYLYFNFEENGILPYNSDVILTYILWTYEDGLDYWRALPQTEYFDSGAILQYNYDFTGNIDNDILYDMAVFFRRGCRSIHPTRCLYTKPNFQGGCGSIRLFKYQCGCDEYRKCTECQKSFAGKYRHQSPELKIFYQHKSAAGFDCAFLVS